MRTIYKVFKKNFQLHSLGRIGFQSDKYTFRGLENENKNYFTVISNCPSPSLSNLKVEKVEENTKYNKNEIVLLSANICFENRRYKRNMFSNEALEKFLKLSGLLNKNAVCKFIPQYNIIKRDFPINNCFEIKGEFIVEDIEKFKIALENGVGSRGSYGFGLIQILTKGL